MMPILFRVGGVEVSSYGVAAAAGLAAAMGATSRLARHVHLDPRQVVDYGLWMLLVGIAGARLAFAIVETPALFADPAALVLVRDGGMVFYGALVAVVGVSAVVLPRRGLSVRAHLDIGAIGLCIGHAFGRLGCLGAGCCHGAPTELRWGIVPPSQTVPGELAGVPLHPVQLYESMALFGLSSVLVRLVRRPHRAGSIVGTYILAYSLIRFGTEAVRGDPGRGTVLDGVLSTSQAIALVAAIAVIAAATMSRPDRLEPRQSEGDLVP